MKEIKIYYHGDLQEIIKSKGNLDENGNVMEGLGHIGGKGKSVCVDLYCAEDIVIEAGEFAYINLGVSMKLPEGFKADIVARSGTFGKYGIIQTNCDGRIDTNYSSKKDVWKMPVFNLLTQSDIRNFMKEVFIKGFNTKWDDENGKESFIKIIDEIEFRKVEIKAGERVAQFEIYEVMGDYTFVKDNLDGEVERNGFGNGTGL
jgi:dUTPase